MLSWLFFIATGFGPFSGQAVHFQHAAPGEDSYAINRYRREIERHYRVLDEHLAGREYDRRRRVFDRRHVRLGMAGSRRAGACRRSPPLAAFPNLQRLFAAIDARPAVARARAVGKGHSFKREVDEETRRAMFPSNYPAPAK